MLLRMVGRCGCTWNARTRRHASRASMAVGWTPHSGVWPASAPGDADRRDAVVETAGAGASKGREIRHVLGDLYRRAAEVAVAEEGGAPSRKHPHGRHAVVPRPRRFTLAIAARSLHLVEIADV